MPTILQRNVVIEVKLPKIRLKDDPQTLLLTETRDSQTNFKTHPQFKNSCFQFLAGTLPLIVWLATEGSPHGLEGLGILHRSIF